MLNFKVYLIITLSLIIYSTADSSSISSVYITENILNPEFPNHEVILNPLQQERSGPKRMIMRCKNKETEAYVVLKGIYGHNGVTKIRWTNAARYTASVNGSNDGTAVFFRDPKDFITRFLREKSVVINTKGYSVNGSAKFILDEDAIDGIHAMAKTCGWGWMLKDTVETSSLVDNSYSKILNLFATKRDIDGPSLILLTCITKKTKASINVKADGSQRVVKLKWSNMSESYKIDIEESSNKTRYIYIKSPVEFFSRFVNERSAKISVEGKSINGSAIFSLDEAAIKNVYKVAKACHWEDQLPELGSVK